MLVFESWDENRSWKFSSQGKRQFWCRCEMMDVNDIYYDNHFTVHEVKSWCCSPKHIQHRVSLYLDKTKRKKSRWFKFTNFFLSSASDLHGPFSSSSNPAPLDPFLVTGDNQLRLSIAGGRLLHSEVTLVVEGHCCFMRRAVTLLITLRRFMALVTPHPKYSSDSTLRGMSTCSPHNAVCAPSAHGEEKRIKEAKQNKPSWSLYYRN